MLRRHGATVAVRLRIIGRQAELASVGIIAEIVVERVIFLAGN